MLFTIKSHLMTQVRIIDIVIITHKQNIDCDDDVLPSPVHEFKVKLFTFI